MISFNRPFSDPLASHQILQYHTYFSFLPFQRRAHLAEKSRAVEESWRAKHGSLAEDEEEESKVGETSKDVPESE